MSKECNIEVPDLAIELHLLITRLYNHRFSPRLRVKKTRPDMIQIPPSAHILNTPKIMTSKTDDFRVDMQIQSEVKVQARAIMIVASIWGSIGYLSNNCRSIQSSGC